MARFWKESDHVLWTLILFYLATTISVAMPSRDVTIIRASAATLLDYAWAAESDLDGNRQAEAQQRLLNHLKWMEDNLPERWGQYTLQQRGEWVFQAMHDRLLNGKYDENQNTLSGALIEGDYNCVSATILFQILTEQAGLPTVAMQTRGHVWCRLLSRPELDIETTCPTWFLLEPHDRDSSPAILAGNEARTLSARGLAAKIPYNKASIAAAGGDYAQAMQLLEFALRLDPNDAAARRNHTAILNNWAVACVSQRDCDQALKVLEQMESQSTHDEQLAENRQKIVDAVIEQWCRTGRFEEALRLLEQYPGTEPSRYTTRSIYEQWIQDATAQGEWLQAKNILRMAMTALESDPLAIAQLRRQYRQLLPS
ncbi:hypothetical protein AB1L30_26785 [Bremerella sp. JC817]|uniref:hypothetical protein n=1 Tax=Bremerella sp. JC817 TaxID=3231756 RepID=UPI00345AC746